MPLGVRNVGGIIQLGGKILGSGGDGSQMGANYLCNSGFPVVGIASTIDNDLNGTEMSVGVDTWNSY